MSTLKTTNIQHASAASAAITLASDGTATASLSSLNGGPLSGTRNRIINGDMRIDQRNAGASVTPASAASNTYSVDRWALTQELGNSWTFQQNRNSVIPPAGFSNYLGITTNSASTPTSGSYNAWQQAIEGFNISDLAWGTANAKQITLSFWVQSSLTGQFSGSLRNGAATFVSYPFTYTINSANTWQYVTVIIPGPTIGTWNSNNGAGVNLFFDLGNGSANRGTAGSWATQNVLGAIGSVNVVATAGATFYITGVQLEAGSVATPFERRSYGQELALCQRYYWIVGRSASGGISSTTQGEVCTSFPVQMRAAPSATLINGTSALIAPGTATSTVTSLNGTGGSTQGLVIYCASTGLTATRPCYINVDNFVGLSAEL